MTPMTFDPVWDEKYAAGHRERWPWDAVVSFVFRHAPRDRPRHDVRVCEVGFGTGNNLWFAACEGFAVSGVEGSARAVEEAKARFAADGLAGDLRTGDFTALPFEDASVDLVIDRGALTCVGLSAMRTAVGEVARILRPGGRFLFNPYADTSTSATSGRDGGDGVRVDITDGTLTGVGQICFLGEAQVRSVLEGWTLHALELVTRADRVVEPPVLHAEWRAIAEKRG